MRGHSHDADEGRELRPKADRIESEEAGLMYKAAAAGRADVLGPAGLLGLQRAVGNAGVASVMEEERSPVLDVVGSGGGAPLDNNTRADMESRLGHDFGDVRVHTDSRAHDSARAVNAHAYTVGSNIVFQRDKYDPSSTEGRTMLAHELTHAVQQRSGPVDGTPTGGGIQVSDPSDRFEREAAANAERAISAPAPVAASPSGPAVQRQEDEGEPPSLAGTCRRSRRETSSGRRSGSVPARTSWRRSGRDSVTTAVVAGGAGGDEPEPVTGAAHR